MQKRLHHSACPVGSARLQQRMGTSSSSSSKQQQQRRTVLRSDLVLHFLGGLKVSGKAEVNDANVSIFSFVFQQQIFRLEVSVNDFVLVHIRNARKHLSNDAGSVNLAEARSTREVEKLAKQKPQTPDPNPNPQSLNFEYCSPLFQASEKLSAHCPAPLDIMV